MGQFLLHLGPIEPDVHCFRVGKVGERVFIVSHDSSEPQCKLPVRTGVTGDEVSDVLGDGGAFHVAAGLNFGGDLFRDIIRPMLKRVEGDNADRVVELARHEIGNYGFEISPLGFGFALNAAQPAKAVNYEVDSLIRAVGHVPWRPACSRHPQLHQTRLPVNLSTKAGNVPVQKQGPRMDARSCACAGSSGWMLTRWDD